MTKKQKYLLGGNQDLIGTIIGLVKNIRRNKSESPGYAVLLYFDHLTARIERYLYNPNFKREEISYNYFLDRLEELENKKRLSDIDIQNLIIYNSKIDHIAELTMNPMFFTKDYKLESHIEDIEEIKEFFGSLQSFHLNTLLDGKLNKRFYSTFYKELIISYFAPGKDRKYYPNPNVTLIKYIERNELLLMKVFERRTSFKDKAITNEIGLPKEPHFYLEQPKTGHLNQIYVPRNFTTELKSVDLFKYNKTYNFKFVPKKIVECPQCILDVKSVINDKTIHDFSDLTKNVYKCNDIIKNKLENM